MCTNQINTIAKEMESVDKVFNKLTKNAVVFGSARSKVTSDEYIFARRLGRVLSTLGYNVITGGGPGIMEAANRGACETGNGKSIGLNIDLPISEITNKYQDISIHFTSFFSRKYAFFCDTDVFFVMPGGDGTLDELYEARTLMHTGMMRKSPIVLCDGAFWKPLVKWMVDTPIERGTISKSAMNGMHIVDNVREALVAGRLI